MGSVPVFTKDPYAPDSMGRAAPQVDRLIGSAYDVVREVAENLEYIKHVSAHLLAIFTVYENIEAIQILSDNIANIETLLENIDAVIEVANNLDEVVAVGANIEAVKALEAVLPQLQVLYTNITDLVFIADNSGPILAVGNNIDSVNAIAANLGELMEIHANLTAILSLIRDFATRADLVSWVAAHPAGTVAGRVYSAGSYQYAGLPGSTAIPDLPGLVPFRYITPQHFNGKGDGATDDTGPIQLAAAYAVAAKGILLLQSGSVFAHTTMTIPAGTTIQASGSTLRALGNLSVAGQRDLVLGANCTVDELNMTRPATGTNTYWMEIGNSTEIDRLTMIADAEWHKNGVWTLGQDVKIGRYYSKNVTRAFDVDNTSTTVQTTGFYMGFAEIYNFFRGIYFSAASHWRVDGYHISGRSQAAKDALQDFIDNGTPIPTGTNAILIGGCSNWVIGDGYIDGPIGSAFRIGDHNNFETTDFQIGEIFIASGKGNGLKMHAGGLVAGHKARRGRVTGVTGIDLGEGPTNDNEELLRLSHVEDIDIGHATAYGRLYARSAQWALKLNNAKRVHIGALRGTFNLPIHITETADTDATHPGGDVTDIVIDSLTGSVVASNILSVSMPTFSIGNIYIRGIDLVGVTTRLADIETFAYTGKVLLSGYMRGTVPPVINTAGAVPGDNVIVDIQWKDNSRITGRSSSFVLGSPAVQQWTVPGTSPGEVTTPGLLLSSIQVTSALGAYGGGLEFTRNGSGRRGAALVQKQTGASQHHTGMAIWVGGGVAASDVLAEHAVFKMDGALQLKLLHEHPDNATAAAGGHETGDLYRKSDGSLHMVVDTPVPILARQLIVQDGITPPAAILGQTQIYVDVATGDLKIIFGDGTVKTIMTDD